MSYEASPVLIESIKPISAGPPVIYRGRGAPEGFKASPGLDFPSLISARFPFPPLASSEGKPLRVLDGGRLTDTLVIEGRGLQGTGVVLRMRNLATSRSHDFTVQAAQLKPASVLFNFSPPTPGWSWDAGLYAVSALIKRADVMGTITTNEVSFSLVPKVDLNIVGPTPQSDNGVLTIKVDPPARKGQSVSILIGALEIPLDPLEQQVDTFKLIFALPGKAASGAAIPAGQVSQDFTALGEGDYPVRIRVNGADSLLFNPADPKLNGYASALKVHIKDGVLSKVTSTPGVPVTP
jgi:hypothetical protein